jgi:hypothetical protein
MNLVFSLVVGAFAVMTYQARTHLTANNNKLQAELAVAKGNAEAFEKRAVALAKQRQDINEKIIAAAGDQLGIKKDDPTETARAVDAMVARITQGASEINDLKKQLADLRTEHAKLKEQATADKVALTSGTKDVEINSANYRRVLGELDVMTKKVTDTVVKLNAMRDVKVATEIERDALKKVNVGLLNDKASLEKRIVELQNKNLLAGRPGSKAGGSTDFGKPPPADLEGRITKIGDRKLVKISVGSDNGLSMNNVLKVFRLGKNPKYLGEIKIVSVQANEAVGRAEGKMYGAMQEGDMVAPTIMGGR